MATQKLDLPQRTKAFAIRVIRLYSVLTEREEARVIGRQLLRSGTAVGAHYREAMHARSRAEFISKLSTALQELEESRYWMELLAEAALVLPVKLEPLQQEAAELIAILTASINTTRRAAG